MFVHVVFDGKVSFDPRELKSAKGETVMSYSIGGYNGKNKETGKTEYIDFDVTDWNCKIKQKFKKGDYVKVAGTLNQGTYVDKNGVFHTTLRVNPDEMIITEFNNGKGD